MFLGKTIPRGQCKIGEEIMYFDFWNSKEKTKENKDCKYLGYGRMVSCRGKSVMNEKDEDWTGHFWRIKSIPKKQNYRLEIGR